MTRLIETPAWKALVEHQAEIKDIHMRDMFAKDSGRFEKYSLRLDDLLFDYSKNRITEKTIELLIDLARQANLADWIKRMFSGDKINDTEDRAVLHVGLRNLSQRKILEDGKDIGPQVENVLNKMRVFCMAVRKGGWKGYSGKPISDIVNIGIGGSDLGPVMVTQALKPYWQAGLHAHFISNVDATHLTETLKNLDPETTLFLVASK
ncbi:MAG: glucose-6-phosphate isomerase, partial [Deltaproteobacteria bacterium]|nr:glucose-6-phosphate isomerase [Deltaproteobacteria bacterium]